MTKDDRAQSYGSGDPPGESLPREHRLRRRSEIKRVQDGGARFPCGCLVLMALPNDEGRRRLGVTVSSTVGNSVVRSRVKRKLRAILRTRRALLPERCDVVLIARASAARATFAEISRDFESAAAKARTRLGASGGGHA